MICCTVSFLGSTSRSRVMLTLTVRLPSSVRNSLKSSVCVSCNSSVSQQVWCAAVTSALPPRGTYQWRNEVAVVVAYHPQLARISQDRQHAVRGAVQQDVYVCIVQTLQQLPATRTGTGTGTGSQSCAVCGSGKHWSRLRRRAFDFGSGGAGGYQIGTVSRLLCTVMRRITTFRSTTDRINDSYPVRLQYNIIQLPTEFSTVTYCTGLWPGSNRLHIAEVCSRLYFLG